MTPPSAPLRFLLLVAGCWIGIRTISLLPRMQAAEDTAEKSLIAPARPEPARASAQIAAGQPLQPRPAGRPSDDQRYSHGFAAPLMPSALIEVRPPQPAIANDPPQLASPARASGPALPAGPSGRLLTPIPAAPPAFAAAQTRSVSRWAGSAWAFIRHGDGGGALAPGGTLGGNQAGARLTYRLNDNSRRPISVSARLYTPLDNGRGAEAALGIDWRPIAAIPINLLAERRQALGRDGRSDFALLLHGGGETRIANGRVRITGYGQAGIVGVEARDLFADGAITATTRIGPIDAGGGAWGGAQPGASRLDLGPHASFRLRVGGTTIRAAAEWRFRVAGDAAPGSGPALTISAGF